MCMFLLTVYTYTGITTRGRSRAVQHTVRSRAEKHSFLTVRFCAIVRNDKLCRVDRDWLPLVVVLCHINPTKRGAQHAVSEGYYVFMHP